MGRISKEKWAQIDIRHGERIAAYGRELELTVEKYLQELHAENIIADFKRHEPNSEGDSDGKDFEVTFHREGQVVTASFGITCSLRRWKLSKLKHPDVPQFCFPIGTNKSTVVKRILSLVNV